MCYSIYNVTANITTIDRGLIMIKIIKKYLLIIFGTLMLALGITGIFIPVLPTTPFLLLTSYCYLKSSKGLYQWLISHKTYGPLIKSYMEQRAIPKKTKIFALSLLWISLIFSMLLIGKLLLSILLSAIGMGVSIYILSLKTLNDESTI